MVKELLKWLQSVGVGAVLALAEYVKAVPVDATGIEAMIHGAILALLVRAFGWLVGKLPQPNP
jgi:hypothetical protein